MLNINVGGTKAWSRVAVDVRKNWLLLDIEPSTVCNLYIQLDLNKLTVFPIKTGSVDNYYCSHTLEHLLPSAVPHVLKEMYRTLKPGGLIRVVVPDVRKAIEMYLKGDIRWLKSKDNPSAKRDDYPVTPLGLLLPWFYSTGGIEHTGKLGHRMAYDQDTLGVYLSKAGFIELAASCWDLCSKVFEGLDLIRHKNTSLFMEAKK